MGVIVVLVSTLSVSLLSDTMTARAETLYLCDDGKTVLLTTREDLGCPMYEPQASLVIVPDGSTFAEAEFAVASQQPEAFQPRRQGHVSSKVPKELCKYQWPDLTLQPRGDGDDAAETDIVAWQYLSGIQPAARQSVVQEPCESYMARRVYPAIR